MRAHLVQLNSAWEDAPANRGRVEELLARAPIETGDLVALPEMFDTGFSLNVERTADEQGQSRAFLRETAKRLGVWLVGGITVRRRDGMGLNRAVVADPGGEVACVYDKLHPFSFGREPERFAPGKGIALFDWGRAGGVVRAQPTVCYDLRFPELYRAGLRAGATAYVVIANWPAARAAHWRALAVARAIENQAFVIAVNRCGDDPFLAYSGGSIVVGPKGEVVAEAGQEEAVLTAKIDPGAVEAWRSKFPAWRDLRTDLAPGPDAGGYPDARNMRD